MAIVMVSPFVGRWRIDMCPYFFTDANIIMLGSVRKGAHEKKNFILEYARQVTTKLLFHFFSKILATFRRFQAP